MTESCTGETGVLILSGTVSTNNLFTLWETFVLVSLSTILLNGVLKGLPCLLLEVIACNCVNRPSFH